MIQAYGTSLKGAIDPKNEGRDKNEKKGDKSKSSFNERVNKRRVIAEILMNPAIPGERKKDL